MEGKDIGRGVDITIYCTAIDEEANRRRDIIWEFVDEDKKKEEGPGQNPGVCLMRQGRN